MENEALSAEQQARLELLSQEGALHHVKITYSLEEEEVLWRNAKCDADYNAIRKLRKERWQRDVEERKKRAWNRSEARLLLDQLGQAYTAYAEYLGQSPQMQQHALENDADNHKIYDQLRANLERANNAPRCAHVKASGERCRAPKMRGRRFCNMHLAMQAARPQKLDLPPLDDPNGVQLAIMRGAQGLVDGTLDQKQAGMLGYYLQLASNNVGRVNFEPEYEDEEYDDGNDG
jgi:hypothetical protein